MLEVYCVAKLSLRVKTKTAIVTLKETVSNMCYAIHGLTRDIRETLDGFMHVGVYFRRANHYG